MFLQWLRQFGLGKLQLNLNKLALGGGMRQRLIGHANDHVPSINKTVDARSAMLRTDHIHDCSSNI